MMESDVEYQVAWWEETMDASAWWNAESITPVHAAMLLCRCNPNSETEESASTTDNGETTGGDFTRLKNVFEACIDKRTLAEWADYAAHRDLKMHSWLGQWRRETTDSIPISRLRSEYSESGHDDASLAALFESVRPEMLKKHFSEPQGKANQTWEKWADRAGRNGLKEARTATRLLNPYLAALWWLKKKAPNDWTIDRCMRVLANHYLPTKNLDKKHILTGEIE
jgi:hypothetical protein